MTKWVIKDKVNKDLLASPYDGTGPKYRDWSANVLNHLLGCNQGWGKIIWLVQKIKDPLTYEGLANTTYAQTGSSVSGPGQELNGLDV